MKYDYAFGGDSNPIGYVLGKHLLKNICLSKMLSFETRTYIFGHLDQ